jgi:hypothetical protein
VKNKYAQVAPFVFVDVRTWTGVDIDGLLAVPVEEFNAFLSGLRIEEKTETSEDA